MPVDLELETINGIVQLDITIDEPLNNVDYDLVVVTGTSDWNELFNVPTDLVFSDSLADVAASGDYNDLTNKPTFGSAALTSSTDYATAAQGATADTAVQPGDLSTVATSGDYADLLNKPTLFTGAYADLTGKPTLFSGAYADLTGLPTLFDGTYASLTGKPTLGTAAATASTDYATAAQGTAADSAVQPADLATVATSGDYADLINKPTLFDGTYASLTGKPTLFDGAYSSLTGTPTFSTVATTGAYSDLTGKPTLATVATTGAYSDLTGKPTLFDGTYASLTGKPDLTTYATKTGVETLTNKTITSPTLSAPRFASGNYIADSTGYPILQFYSVGSPSSYVSVTNASGSTIDFTAQGTATNSGFTFTTKGTGTFTLSVPTAQTATIAATGPDASHSLNLTTKGSGTIKANGVDLVTLSATQTLTSKTLTSPGLNSPRIIDGLVKDINSNSMMAFTATDSAVNYFSLTNNVTGSAPALGVTGSDTNVSLNLTSKGSGTVKVNGVDVVTTTGTQTLTAKTLTTPKIDYLYDTYNNHPVVWLYSSASAVNGLWFQAADAGSPAVIQGWSGSEADVGLNLTTQGSGTVQANGLPVVTTTGAATLTNKVLTSPTMSSPKISDGIIKDANGNTWLAVSSGSSPIGNLYISNSNSGIPVIGCQGSVTDVSISLRPKGSGVVKVTGDASQSSVSIWGESSATDCSLNLLPKGSGKVQANGVEVATISGTQTLTNKTLTTPILANPKFTDSVYANDGSPLLSTNQTASAVNYLQISNRATGVAPSLHAVGSDTNINLNLISKGSGVVTANSVEIATISGTQTLTNKRITPRVGTTTSSATPAINTDTTDQYTITAQAADITSMSSSLTGTPTDGQKLIIRIKDNGTARAITWGTSWRAIGVTLPTTTTVSKTMYVGAVYNSADSKWDVLAVGQEA